MIASNIPRALDTSRAPQDPQSDPEHKLGDTPAPETLAREAEIQRSGDATRGSIINAHTPGPTEPGGNSTRDPEIEHQTP